MSKTSPNLIERISRSLLLSFLHGLHRGKFTLIYPDGTEEVYGGSDGARQSTIRLKNYKIFWKILKNGAIGLGESYVDGDWETESLPDVVALFLENLEIKTERRLNVLRPFRWINNLIHRARHNSKSNARKNIHAHYDLGNQFFSLLLDRSMTYSSGVFNSRSDSLEHAQRNKLRLVMEKAMISADDHVLEIGSGWGSFALLAAKERGCRVTTITLSEEQKRYVEQRIRDEKLEGQIEVRLCDYRDIRGSFDKIVSIEMMEAIGKQYLGSFFERCEALIKPTGIAVVQVITMVDFWYDEYCKRCDWIQKYIFPGSHLPSLTALSESITKNSNFVIEKLENFAPHYARTLELWRARLHEIGPRIEALGYDTRFQRMFDYYLASCEAEFGSRWLNLLQITLTRPNNPLLMAADSQSLSHAPVRIALSAS